MQNLEKTLRKCAEILNNDNDMDYNIVLEDLSFVLYKLDVEDTTNISDESWKIFLSMIDICLSKPTEM